MSDCTDTVARPAKPSEAAQAAFDAGALAFVENDLPTAIAKLTECLRLEPAMDAAAYLLALAELRAGALAAGRKRLEGVAGSTPNVMLRDMARSKLALVDRLAGSASGASEDDDTTARTVR